LIEEFPMRIGFSLFLIAAGAILKWAVSDHVTNVNLSVIGVILMIVGVVGLILSLVMAVIHRRTEVVHDSGGSPVDGRPGSQTTYR